MSVNPESRKLLDSMLNSVPDLHAVVILVDHDGRIETGTANLGDDPVRQAQATMMICFSLATEIAQQLQADGHGGDLPTVQSNGRSKHLIILPPGWQNGLGRN